MRSLQSVLSASVLALTMLSPVAWCKPPEAKLELVGQVRVDATGLDLRKPADARTLLTRIEKAAYRACGGNPKLSSTYDMQPRRTVEVYERCRESAISRTVDQLGSAQLAQIYKAERQAPPAASSH